VLLHNLGTDRIEHTASKNSSTVACLFVAARKCLFSCCLVADNFFWLHYSGFQPLCDNTETFTALQITIHVYVTYHEIYTEFHDVSTVMYTCIQVRPSRKWAGTTAIILMVYVVFPSLFR
jgi:hypothetical protein